MFWNHKLLGIGFACRHSFLFGSSSVITAHLADSKLASVNKIN